MASDAGRPPACHIAAFFDVDGTIVAATVVHYYAYFATKGRSSLGRFLWTLAFLPRIVYYLFVDRISRSRFNRIFYENYRGMDARQARSWRGSHFDEVVRPRIFPGAVDCIAEHRRRGERIVLITGSLDFIMEPLAEWLQADALIAAQMTEEEGRLTGVLTGPPIGDDEKARMLRTYAAEHGIDLTRSYAYADSRSDLPMLEAVGHAVVVNPGRKLKMLAEKNGWKEVAFCLPSST